MVYDTFFENFDRQRFLKIPLKNCNKSHRRQLLEFVEISRTLIIQDYKGKFRFAVSDEEEFADELQSVGLGDSGLEQNVLAFGYDGKKYPMDPDRFDGDFDENFAEFMEELNYGNHMISFRFERT